MGDYELAIKRCKRLEELLEQALGATGRGLHEKVTSVEAKLPGPLVKRLRFIATVRNRLVHETSVDRIDDRAGFERAFADAEGQLSAMLQPARGSRIGWGVVVVVACVVAALAVVVVRALR